ncbi:hypothetical protein FJTKL_03397 [Diaporthe vaccinii]|uniref:Uncharacterized protein n=1 Tax=Diaporthe vaccinii TaxID=105482 RepID=A0ABR4F1Y9_9PEZI
MLWIEVNPVPERGLGTLAGESPCIFIHQISTAWRHPPPYSPSSFAPRDDFPLSRSPKPIKLLMKQSRPMKCYLVRVGGYRGAGGWFPGT